jgi:two-component system response regulator FixJ
MRNRHILLVDKDPTFRASACVQLLESGFTVDDFDGAGPALVALRRIPHAVSACLIVDIDMSEPSGAALLAQLREESIAVPVIYTTEQVDVVMVARAMHGGGLICLKKPLARQALELALRLAFDGMREAASAGDARFGTALASAGEPMDSSWLHRMAQLTPREREVHHWIMQDKLNKTISDLLGISIKTVEMHRANLMRKLGATSLAHLVKMTVSGRVW